MSQIKGTSRRSWLTDEDLRLLQKISERTKLGQTEVLSQILRAGLISIANNDHSFRLPLRFQVADEPVDGSFSRGELNHHLRYEPKKKREMD